MALNEIELQVQGTERTVMVPRTCLWVGEDEEEEEAKEAEEADRRKE